MSLVALVRIDDRLIHGQVVVKWVRYLDCDRILIVDDALWRDEFMRSVLRLAAPAGVHVQVTSVQGAASCLGVLASRVDGEKALETSAQDNAGSGRTLVLVRSPQVALALLENGFAYKELNVGGLASGEGTVRLHKSVSASSEQIAALHAIRAKGVQVYFQTVPEERRVELPESLPVR